MLPYTPECWICKKAIGKDGEFIGCCGKKCEFEYDDSWKNEANTSNEGREE